MHVRNERYPIPPRNSFLIYVYYMHIFMKIIWAPNKANRNSHKRNVRFSDAESVLFDPYALTIEDTTSEDEQRYVSTGMDSLGRILVVVFTYRVNEIRLISARRAIKKERRHYETGI